MRAVAVPPIDIANAISDALKIELKRQIERERDRERKREQEIVGWVEFLRKPNRMVAKNARTTVAYCELQITEPYNKIANDPDNEF